jgi:prepilin-type N-terminal cleavage/methylation domain-containing protein
MKDKIFKKTGFTLLEMMLVIAMLAIIVFVSREFYGSFALDATVDNSAKTITFDLRNVRDRAMNGQNDSNWGIHFANASDDYYEIFSTPTNYADVAKVIESKNYLSGNIKFSSPSEGNNLDVIFTKVSGTTFDASVIIMYGTNQKTITVKAQGLIN